MVDRIEGRIGEERRTVAALSSLRWLNLHEKK